MTPRFQASLAAAFLASASGPPLASGADGTIPNRTYPAGEVFQQISPQLGVRHMNQPSVVNGYAILAGNGAHEVWDISDPYNPTHLADMLSNHRAGEGESHQVTYAKRGDRLYMATISGRGIDIWDVTDTPNPVRLGETLLPGINYGDVAGALWGICWQGDHVYAGATTNGLYIIDVSDPADPRLATTLPPSAMGGMIAGPLFALGNLLVITAPKGERGVATVDISNPLQPRFLDAEIEGGGSYIGGFYGKNAHLIGAYRAYDVTTDPRNIRKIAQVGIPASEYMSFADDKFFLGGLRGGSEGVWKYDISDPTRLVPEGRFVGRDTRWDDQFSCPVGNLLLIADDQLVDDHYVGGLVAVHAAEPDTTPPQVRYANPVDGSERQAITSRIGISLSDWIELASLDSSTFVVRPVGGEPISGTWSCTYTTITFAPDELLEPGTTYEIILPAGGLTDLVGNPISTEFRSTFTTTAQPGFPGNDEVNTVQPTELGLPITFSVKQPDAARLYEWRFPDGTALHGPSVSHIYASPGRHNVTMETRIDPVQLTEAEEAELLGGVLPATNNAGYSGTAFVDYPGEQGTGVAIRWTVVAERASSTSLFIRYANAGGNRPLHLVVNDGAPRLVNLPTTSSWTNWVELELPSVPVNAGVNTLELRASAGSGGPNVDFMRMTFEEHPDDERRITSFMHLVHPPLTAASPASSQALCIDRENGLIWAANTDANTITAVDLETLAKVREVPVGHHPETLAVAPDGTIWVANRDSHSLTIVTPTTGATSEVALPYASQPFGIAFAPDGSSAFVSLQALGRVVRIDPTTRQITTTTQLPNDPNGILPQVRGLAISADSQKVYASRFISPSTRGEVFEIDTSTMTLSRTIALGPSAMPDSPVSARGIPNYLMSLTIAPDGLRAWIPSKQDNIFRGTFRDGLPLDHDITVRAVASQIDLGTGGEVSLSRLDFDDRDRAHSLSFSPLGDLVFVTMPGNNHVSVHDAYTRQEVSRIASGATPVACVIDEQRGRLHVLNFLSRSLSVYDISELFTGGSLVEGLSEVPLVAVEPLPAQVLHGKKLFYDATSTKLNSEHYMSCASCHVNGHHDGRVWDLTNLGEGLRNTIDLRGRAGTRHGRLHWSGNFDEVHDFENQIRQLGRGEGLMTDTRYLQGTRSDPLGMSKAGVSEDLDALAAYVASLDKFDPSPFRNTNGTLTSDAIAGRQVFNTLRCYDCHGGRNFTDSRLGALHDVGTLTAASGTRAGAPLTGLDTPTLRGVWAGAPYLHDGSAPSLRDVLTTRNPAGQHGSTSSLTSTQIDQLIAYLRQIDGDEPAASPPAGIGSPSYDIYIANFPDLDQTGEDIDSDGDTFASLAEYALGATDPTQSGSHPVFEGNLVRHHGEDYLAYSYLRLKNGHWEDGIWRVGDLAYQPQATADMQAWAVPIIELPTPAGLPEPPEHYEWGTFGCPVETSQRFVRVSVTRIASEDL